jgi:uridylate kinase
MLEIGQEIKDVREFGVEIAIVIGGGTFPGVAAVQEAWTGFAGLHGNAHR